MPSRWDPKGVTYTKVDSAGERTRYEVWLGDQVIGHVFSRKVESWRQLPSGVRYGLRGTPTEWGYVDLDRDNSGPLWGQRSDAARRLVDHMNVRTR